MPSIRSTKAKRASKSDVTGLRQLAAEAQGDRARGANSRGGDTGSTDEAGRVSESEAAGRPAQRSAIEQAMAQQNVRLGRSPGAVGPIGRTVLLVALGTLVVLIAVWLVLVL